MMKELILSCVALILIPIVIGLIFSVDKQICFETRTTYTDTGKVERSQLTICGEGE